MKKPIKRKSRDASVIRDYVEKTREMAANIDGNYFRVFISTNNVKMNSGAAVIPSVSLPPVLTCANCSQCSKYCYALKMARLKKMSMVLGQETWRYIRPIPTAISVR